MCLDLVQVRGSICTIYDTSISTEQWKKNRSFEKGEEMVCYIVLCYALHFETEEALYSTACSPAFQTFAHNAWIASDMQDIENSQFWRAIYCLLRVVIPLL